MQLSLYTVSKYFYHIKIMFLTKKHKNKNKELQSLLYKRCSMIKITMIDLIIILCTYSYIHFIICYLKYAYH